MKWDTKREWGITEKGAIVQAYPILGQFFAGLLIMYYYHYIEKLNDCFTAPNDSEL